MRSEIPHPTKSGMYFVHCTLCISGQRARVRTELSGTVDRQASYGMS